MVDHSHTRSLWWRWSWRDLRQHWISVLSIAAVVAIGTGVYAGLGSTSAWRRISNDTSFAALNMHDLRAQLSPGTFTATGSLHDAATSIPHASWVDAVDERLVVDSQIDASTADEVILVSARIVGSDFAEPETVDALWISHGEFAADAPEHPTGVLETKFADYYDLPSAGAVRMAGGIEFAYTGVGVAPEDFYVTGVEGSVFAHADLATVYTSLSVAQQLAGRSGVVNDLVLTLVSGADRDIVQAELANALGELGGVSATVTTREQADAHRVLYEDIENDQQIWNALSILVVLAAALAAFNLISRIVEAQRREIGIGMALGVRRNRLAIRPLLVGVQVGAIGTLAGVGVGILIGNVMRGLLESILPLPNYVTPFQFGVFARGAALGIVPPLVAAALPVWRAVRVEPIKAIRTGHLAATTGHLGSWTRRVRLPGSTTATMPLRNLLRAPRRTVLTAIGVGAAITALVAVLAMLDSFNRAIDRGAAEITKGDAERVTVVLDTYYPLDSQVVAEVEAAPTVGTVDATLRMPATAASAGHRPIELVLELLDLEQAAWTPTIVRASADGPTSGVVLAEKAAHDLGVDVGDRIELTHPQREGLGYTMTESVFVVAAIHPNPIRTFAYLDSAFADDFGLQGITNSLQVTPSAGSARADVQRSLFPIAGVASAQPVARLGEVFDEALEQFVGFLMVTAGAVLLLALLIAFNSSRISVEERRREHATMLAFGVPVRRVVGTVVAEAVVVGLLATAIGTLAGLAALQWMLNSLAQRTLPEFAIERYASPSTLGIALLVGVVAVAIAPLFLARRISTMNLPDTLRVME